MKNLKDQDLREMDHSELEETTGGVIGVVLFPFVLLLILHICIGPLPEYMA